ncbi:MAG: efflux RND transporter permease subunit, partial [Acetobacter sp.]|nr:efflux RND transporter permease subunit [Acetobacter sp.]
AARQAIGTAVVGGMLTATLLAVYFVPVFFTIVLRIFKIKRQNKRFLSRSPSLPPYGNE